VLPSIRKDACRDPEKDMDGIPARFLQSIVAAPAGAAINESIPPPIGGSGGCEGAEMIRIRAEKDFWAGMMYVALAAAFLWFGRDYRMGAAARMGPGYFPITLGWILAGFGAVSILRSLLVAGEPIGGIAWRKLAVITLSVVLFGLMLEKAGLVIALPVLVIVSAFASKDSVFDLKALAILAALTIFCILVFVKGLGVPMPILGSWFADLVPAAWQR
jgi:Tripartite tricarboxylate transporter TctB family